MMFVARSGYNWAARRWALLPGEFESRGKIVLCSNLSAISRRAVLITEKNCLILSIFTMSFGRYLWIFNGL